mmetsp:Transcript_7191/g.17417  ORF Transcript_7191/g.17417 Transcript_7191/m.17417 type:complete len:205 (-) Transcript_7191:1238-1852(-)
MEDCTESGRTKFPSMSRCRSAFRRSFSQTSNSFRIRFSRQICWARSSLFSFTTSVRSSIFASWFCNFSSCFFFVLTLLSSLSTYRRSLQLVSTSMPPFGPHKSAKKALHSSSFSISSSKASACIGTPLPSITAKTLSLSSGGFEHATKMVLGSSFGLLRPSSKHFSNICTQSGGYSFAPHSFAVSCLLSHLMLSAAPFFGSDGG